MSAGSASGDPLEGVLEEARALGFLGPGPVHHHIAHALGFAAQVPSDPRLALDLGSGGGVPGLVLAGKRWPGAAWTLVEAGQRRSEFLARAAAALGVGDRVAVHWARAEEAGRHARLRGAFDLVVARSFGPPAVTAECAAAFLAVGGLLVVSEPPDERPERWDEEILAGLGLVTDELTGASPWRFARFRQVVACPPWTPRRTGVPSKRPLF